MTYGEVAERLRESMIWLLECRRISQRLGGQRGVHNLETTSREKREALGVEIQCYRAALVTYCLEAVRAVTPAANLENDERFRYPAVALRYRLEVTHAGLPQSTRLSSLLERRPHLELVQRWQGAARIAVEGERELATLRRSALSREQQAQILKDTAVLVRGLVALDLRYKHVPGWRLLEHQGRLLNAAVAIASKPGALDPSVDALGWRPTPGIIEGPALPGLAGVLQAQHNTVVHLGHFPSAWNLRHVLVAQADLAQQAARVSRSVAPSSTSGFQERASLYRKLVSASRALGGEIGEGCFAALESAHAARRMRSVVAPEPNAEQLLCQLARLGERTDARVSAAIEHGFREKLYFTAIKLPTPGTPGPGGIIRPAQKYIPVDSPAQSTLLTLVRDRLRPARRLTGQYDAPGCSACRERLNAMLQRERDGPARSR